MSGYIPEDCLPEILKRLPVKSLARFRCVCRRWNALICSSYFIADHLACSKAKPLFFIDGIPPKPSQQKSGVILDSDSRVATFIPHIIPALIPEPIRYYEVVGSAKGIICTHVHRYRGKCGEKAKVVLWNPMINKYIKLPESHARSTSYCTHELIAIGVKPSEDDIRVLRVAHYRNSEPAPVNAAEIYSVGQGAWQVLQANIPSCKTPHNWGVKYCLNGSVYWVAVDDADSYMLIRFGFEEEEFSCIILPDVLAHSYHIALHVGVYCGGLALFQQHYCEDLTHSRWKMWTRGGNEDSWSVIISINPLEEYNYDIHGITHDGQILMTRYRHYDYDDDLMLCNSKSTSFHQLDMRAAGDGLRACPFVESLVFMDGEGGALTLPPPSEEFSTMALPEVVAESERRNVHAAVYCEKLVVKEIGVGEESYCKIWTMGEYGNVDSWSVVIRIDTSARDNFVHRITFDGQIILSVVYDNDLLLYDSTKGDYRRLGMKAVEKRFCGCEYVESLVFMDGKGGACGVSFPLELPIQ